MKNFAKILVFKSNSCYNYKTIKVITNNSELIPNYIEEFNINKINDSNDLVNLDNVSDKNIKNTENNKKLLELAEKKKNIQHKINIINYNKNKITEYKNLYETDFKLFNKFNNLLISDSSFIIPELFQDKFNIFTSLLNNNNLNFNSFIKEFYKDKFNNEILINKISDSESDDLNTIEEFEISSNN